MRFFFLYLAILSLPLHAQEPSSSVLILGTKQEWAPYHINTDHGADGLAVRAVACVMARINQPFKIIKLPWARAQYNTEHGSLDGFFAASQNEVRDSYATLSELFLPQERVFYLLKSKANQALSAYTIEYIKEHMSVAARAGSNALVSLQKGDFNIQATPLLQDQLLVMLENGRVDAVLENSLVFPELIKNAGKNLDDYHAVVYQTKNMGVYFGRNFLQRNPEFLARFNANLPPCSLLKK